jgi:hypothetical protein
MLDDVVASLKRHGATKLDVRPAEDRVFAIFGDGGSHHIYIGNAFADYERVPYRERPKVVERFLKGLLLGDESKPDFYAAARPKLIPVVRSAGEIGIADLMTRQHSDKPAAELEKIRMVRRRFAADMVACLVLDHPDSMSYVTEEMLVTWGVSVDKAFEDAIGNLRGLP